MNDRTTRAPRNAGAVALATVLIVGAQARAQPGGNPSIFMDEFGAGSIQLPGGPVNPIQGFPQFDPGPGGLPNALTYVLQPMPPLPIMIVGDLLLQDAAGGPFSECIRFNQIIAGVATAVFYSDPPEAGEPPSPADTGLPAAFYPNQSVQLEVAIPGGFGVIYTPLPNEPGFMPGFNVTYTILSDVPAPGTLALLGMGGLWAVRRRRA